MISIMPRRGSGPRRIGVHGTLRSAGRGLRHTFEDDPERALANLLPDTVVRADDVVGRGGIVGGHGGGRRGAERRRRWERRKRTSGLSGTGSGSLRAERARRSSAQRSALSAQ